MKQVTLLHIDLTNKETVVAKFKKLNEAESCRDLMQAKCSDQSTCWYYVEFYNKATKTNIRRGADSFASQVHYMEKTIKQNILLHLSGDQYAW
jgi:hypothetical protein